MGSFHLTGMALRNLVRRPATRRYPVEPQQYTPMTKGHVVNDIELCILCSICQKKCPADAIVVDKPAGTWSINPFACVQCNTCVRACPKKSLTMLPEYSPVATAKTITTLIKPVEEPKADK
jgi:formate hydrogenlyase subunit 6/NADH:ubiquinone oxidoreductase subunit I